MSLDETKQHLETVFSVYRDSEYEDGLIGIAHSASAIDLTPKVERHFSLDQITEAAEYAQKVNKAGCNVYTPSGLLFGVENHRSSLEHFYSTEWIVTDIDEDWDRSYAAIKEQGLTPTIYVRTAETPNKRVQLWYQLKTITGDIDDIRDAAPALNAAVCADANSIDTGYHLFRVAGTINYPTEYKKAQGRKAEPVALRVTKNAPKYDVYALSQLKPHPEYNHTPAGGVGKGGAALGIVRDEHGKVTDGREYYWRSIVLAMIGNFQETHGSDPTVDEVFDDCFPTFEANLAPLGDKVRDTRWTSPHGQAALRKRVNNTLQRLKVGRLAKHGLYSFETGVNRELAELKAAERSAPLKVVAEATPKINWQRLSELRDVPLQEREWAVDEWIPKGQVSLLYADGGIGKSQVMIQLLSCVALGKAWFGLLTTKGRALYLGAEDDLHELHRRFDGVISAENKDYSDFDDVIFSSMAGEDALLATYDARTKKLTPSALLKELEAAIKKHSPTLCVIDTLADVFPADENDRSLARQFIGMLRKPAIEYNCAILVLAHPSLSGLSSGRGTSGSTGWNNSVRSRITMKRDENNADRRFLEIAKSNYSKTGDEISIIWKDGIFVHEPHLSSNVDERNDKAKRVFLRLLNEATENGKNVNKNGGATYAPKVFADDPSSEGVTKKAFLLAMQSLLHDGVISNEPTKRGSRLVMGKTA